MFDSAQVNPLQPSPILLPTKLPNISPGIHVGEKKNKLIINYLIFGEGNGTPLQYSCLENPMDGGA